MGYKMILHKMYNVRTSCGIKTKNNKNDTEQDVQRWNVVYKIIPHMYNVRK